MNFLDKIKTRILYKLYKIKKIAAMPGVGIELALKMKKEKL